MKKIAQIICFILIANSIGFSSIDSHPRVLLDSDDLSRISSQIRTNELARQDFLLFSNNKKNSETAVPFMADISTLHQLLNKIMKNSFLYLMGSHDLQLQLMNGYEPAPEIYIQHIEADIQTLMQPEHIRQIQNSGGLEAPGLAVKALAIAYDWGYDYFAAQDRNKLVDLENTLRTWADWYTTPERYYGSVFENHAPWDAKALAYLAAALGDENLFYGTETKIQVSTLPDNDAMSVQSAVNISAKGFFDQIVQAVTFVASPRGGWHEGMSYFLGKEIPELLEYAEIVCTFHHQSSYTNSIYMSPLFKNAGLFLYHMTTPDGMLQKIGDTASKTALPAEFYEKGGNSYGDINNIGAGYLAGYFLQQLYNRLLDAGAPDHAQLAKFYADSFCFDFNGQMPNTESDINLIYSLMWRNYAASTVSRADVEQNALITTSIYFENTGILISKKPAVENTSSTIVRFDAQPYFFSGHQHFAAGNFTIFKGANLAIDGGRYIIPKSSAGRDYYENVYRHSLSHNVLLFDDNLAGQKSFQKQPNRAPYTLQQLDSYQEYGTGPENVSVFLSEQQGNSWNCPWDINGMTLDLSRLYDHLGVENYSRQLLHIFNPGSNSVSSDFVLEFDDVALATETSAHWQLHFRDNGENLYYGDSVFVIVRDEPIEPHIVKSDFSLHYKGQLFVKSFSDARLSIVNFNFPDSICQQCWNGRVWEESTHILRLTSATKNQHEFLTVLAPMQLDTVSTTVISTLTESITATDQENSAIKSIKIRNQNDKDDTGALYIHIIKPQQESQNRHQLYVENLENGWMIFYGIKTGKWEIILTDRSGDILETENLKTYSNNDPKADWGVLTVPFVDKYEGHGKITVSLIHR